MLRQFHLSPELQQFLSGVDSAALSNITWDTTFEGVVPVLPVNSNGIRRSLMFSKAADDGMATPALEYNCYLATLDLSSEQEVTYPRGP